MDEHIIGGIVNIIILGVSAQWIAMRLKMPSILFLLIFGFLGGPVTGLINPDAIFGDLLFPFISLSIAVILFEGGMDLKLSELKEAGKIIWNLITIGVLISWILISLCAYFILDFDIPLSFLLGAILVVTGPTVIGPLLRHVRPAGRVAHIVKWEGIMIDPIGVILAILVFEVILHGNFNDAGIYFMWGVLKTSIIGVLIGGTGAFALLILLKRYLIPDSLEQVVTLMFIFTVFVVSNHFQAESGLLSVTLMGIILANQKKVSVQAILEFKENLRTLIISVLFIILAARLDLKDFQSIQKETFLFIVLLFVIVRPLSVIIASAHNKLSWKEVTFISCMAPRGIVAAAMASIFAYELKKAGHPEAEKLIPIVFLVIISTVSIYGLMAMPVARWLGLAVKNPQGVLFVGAHSWTRVLGQKLQSLNYKVILADTNLLNISQAKALGLETYHGTVFSEHIEDDLNLSGIGKMLALTRNDEANSLAVIKFIGILGRENVYQLSPAEIEEREMEVYSSKHFQGRYLFQKKIDFSKLNQHIIMEDNLMLMSVTNNFVYEEHFGENKNYIPLFCIEENKDLIVISADEKLNFKPGEQILAVSI